MAKSRVKVVQTPEKPVSMEIMATAIRDVSAAAKKLLNSPLTDRAIITLIQDSMGGRTKISRDDISLVLGHASELAETFLKVKRKGSL